MVDKVQVEKLKKATSNKKLLKYLEKELGWPIDTVDLEDNFFDYSPEELQFKPDLAAKIKTISRLRPPSSKIEMPWGIFFIEFSTKDLPLIALRRILNHFVTKKRQSKDLQSWEMGDLLFVSNYGANKQRKISLCLFNEGKEKSSLPRLKVIEWSDQDTSLALEGIANTLKENLEWPDDDVSKEDWQIQWQSAFISEHRAAIRTSKDLAQKLAELAKNVKNSVQEALVIEDKEGYLHQQLKEFKKVLIHDLNETAFADMYAQTIAYGLLTAEITNPKNNEGDRIGEIAVTNPFLKELLKSFLEPDEQYGASNSLNFDELEISEIKELLDNSDMRAILRDFGAKNPEEDPVIQFYELFLQEYDSEIKKTLGVFYTPRSVVRFIVRSVDELLQTEFNLKYGLADTTTWGEMIEQFDELEIPEGATHDQAFVQILDPATGTGTFLIETIDLIYKTMKEKWQSEGCDRSKIDHLWNDYVPNHLLPRLHAYELMMAPYAIAHIQIGLKLYETGYSFKGDEMARIFFTNSLEPPEDFSGMFDFVSPDIAQEAEIVNSVKRDQRFTVIIGNPPYFGNAGPGGDWIADLMRGMENQSKELSENYFEVDGKPLGERNPKHVNDDYVKFIRLSQWCLDRTGVGVLGFITNNGYLDNPTFRGMRESLTASFNKISIVDLHGSYMKNETAPDGSVDENVFDIRTGVGIACFTKPLISVSRDNIRQIDSFGRREIKYKWLNTISIDSIDWNYIKPVSPDYLLVPQDEGISEEYQNFWSITDIMPTHTAGFITHRDKFAIDFDKNVLRDRILEMKGDDLNDAEYSEKYNLSNSTGWQLSKARHELRNMKDDWEKPLMTCLYRPFDERSCYFNRVAMDRPRRVLLEHVAGKENLCLLVSRQTAIIGWQHVFVSAFIAERMSISLTGREGIINIPLYVYKKGFMSNEVIKSTNFDESYHNEISSHLGLKWTGLEKPKDDKSFSARNLFSYIYAILHSDSYRTKYAKKLSNDFPRIPLLSNPDLFFELIEFGQNLIDIHLVESPNCNNHITFPLGSGNFQVEKISYSDETVWINKAKTQGFQGVPEAVWNFRIGGYQVCEKWLKERQAKGGKNPRPGRVLSDEDINHYQKIIVALSETIRIMGEIDEVIEEHGGWPDAFIK